MDAREFFRKDLEVEILSHQREEMTDRKTGELVVFYRLQCVYQQGGVKKAEPFTCGSKAFPAEGLKDGGKYVLRVFPRTRNNYLAVGVAQVLPLAAVKAA